jgi:glutamate/tyrosine decarboxylase-like PLP-dependent enzyme
MLGAGRSAVTTIAAADGAFDLPARARGLRSLRGAPAVVVASAGAANTGGFDPLSEIAALGDAHGGWLHVDAAFGLFARLTPRTAALTDGIERAHSVAADAHKWLNVPHECGIALVHDPRFAASVFGASAAYIGAVDDSQHEYGSLGPEMSRRARATVLWATLHAYGRRGHRELVERCLDLTAHLVDLVEAAPELELLADPALNVVCFRYRPSGWTDAEVDELNLRLGEAVLTDGRVYIGTTELNGRRALRAVVINWRTTREDVDLLVRIVREMGAGLSQS